jgi:hypothetical protein
MPTGYTQCINEGATFTEFAIECARAFGATITMRDDPMGTPIPKFEPSDYHPKRLAESEKRLKFLESLTPEQIQEQIAADYKKELESYNERKLANDAQRARYEAVLSKVNQWQPPTENHMGLKSFMAEQIKESIKFDCSPSELPEKLTPGEWYDKQIKSSEWSVKYHKDEYAKEVERTTERNEWVRQLKASLSL